MMLTADACLSADDLKREIVAVPEWGGTITIREMTSAAAGELEAWRDRQGMLGYAEMIVILSAINPETGNPLFERSQLKRLGKKSSKAITRIVEAATRLNALDDAAVESLKKKSETAPMNGSGTELNSNTDHPDESLSNTSQLVTSPAN